MRIVDRTFLEPCEFGPFLLGERDELRVERVAAGDLGVPLATHRAPRMSKTFVRHGPFTALLNVVAVALMTSAAGASRIVGGEGWPRSQCCR